jgi:hypothetical protein
MRSEHGGARQIKRGGEADEVGSGQLSGVVVLPSDRLVRGRGVDSRSGWQREVRLALGVVDGWTHDGQRCWPGLFSLERRKIGKKGGVGQRGWREPSRSRSAMLCGCCL